MLNKDVKVKTGVGPLFCLWGEMITIECGLFIVIKVVSEMEEGFEIKI